MYDDAILPRYSPPGRNLKARKVRFIPFAALHFTVEASYAGPYQLPPGHNERPCLIAEMRIQTRNALLLQMFEQGLFTKPECRSPYQFHPVNRMPLQGGHRAIRHHQIRSKNGGVGSILERHVRRELVPGSHMSTIRSPFRISRNSNKYRFNIAL